MAKKRGDALRLDEREEIEKGIKRGDKIGTIARIIGRTDSCIKQEIRRNGGRQRYNAKDAEYRANTIQKYRVAKITQVFSPEQEEAIKAMLSEGKSMNYICNQMNINHCRLRKFIDKNEIAYKSCNYTTFIQRIEALELQVQILTDQIKEILCRK